MLLGTTVGVILTAMLGAAIARRELQPTQRLVQQVNRINVEQLSYRVDAPTRPAEVREIANAFNEMLQRLETGYERLYRFSADLAHDNAHAVEQPDRARRGGTLQGAYRSGVCAAHGGRPARVSATIAHDRCDAVPGADGANIRLDTVSIDLAEELSKLADYFSMLAEERGITISVTASGRLMADPMLFRRAINNLLVNAVELAESDSTVVIRSAHIGGDVVIHVTNRGQAIPEWDIEHIFERFYRADRARSNSHRSIGLGLAIVRSIMDLHGGTAGAENLEGGLIRFELRFRGGRTA
ncbi:ATP-binding protein [Cupriavidus alkaliphilus]|uniref:ATP-binding protein n=1 Tax=Cupriavidus alkaliphilus TaxID=942866 RepID=UPI00339D87AD